MPKTKTKRTEYNKVTGMKTKSSIPSNKFKTKKMLERREKLYNMWKSNRPNVAEMKKAFKENNMAVLNYPTFDEFVAKKNRALHKSGGKKKD
tara:strand:+ start:1769 stop:2044 length:276 start_codon:yes stop_codon:yes gene_type:complete